MPYADPTQKRGRPRKVVDLATVEPKRPRGRPKKVAEVVSKCPVGRPRKNPATVTNIITLCAFHASTCKILFGSIVIDNKRCLVCGGN